MSDYKTKSVCITDNGLFPELARTLSRSFGKVYYTSPWVADFPSSMKIEIGEGFDDYERVPDIWDIVNDVDLFVFPDLHNGHLQLYLQEQGKRVFGARIGDELETQRVEAKDHFNSLGIPQAPYEVVVGMDKLRKHIQSRGDEKVWVKISLTRNDTETFPVEGYELSKNRLDKLESEIGPAAEHTEFIVEDDLPGTLDIAIDTFCIDGQYPESAMLGTEKKDEGYLAVVKPWDNMPKGLVSIYDAVAPTLQKYGYRSMLSLESRLGPKTTYLCDPCCRGGSPPFELQMNMIENLAEIMWEGADGNLVEPRFKTKYGAEVIVESKWAINNPLLLEFPDKYRDSLKFRYATMIDGKLWIMPQKHDTPGIGAIVTTGNSIEECFAQAEEISQNLKGIQVEAFCGSVDGLKSNLAQLSEWGVKF